MTAKEWHKILIDEEEISKDDNPLPHLIILGALENGKGAVKRHVKKWIGKDYLTGHFQDFEKMWNIAVKQKIFVKGKITAEDPGAGLSEIELSLYALCLKGFITKSKGE